MVYAAMIELYAVHAHLLFRVGVTTGEWEFWAMTACLTLAVLAASLVDTRSWRWRRWWGWWL